LPTLRAQKSAQRWRFYHLPGSYGCKTLQRVPLDSLRVGAVEIGRIIAPDRRQHRQEAPKRILATLAWFFGFLVGLMWRGGVVGCLYSFQTLRRVWEALKDKIHAGGF